MAETIAQRTVLYSLPEASGVEVRTEPYDGDLVIDVYALPRAQQNTPAVVLVSGYPDTGFEKIVGCKFKDMGSSQSWARLLAASGLVAITYTNRTPENDLHAVLQHVRTNIADRIGVWASSGNVPLALSLLMGDSLVQCAALCYGYTFDVDEQAKQFRFAYPISGKSIDDLSSAVPLFLARAGGDETPGLNAALDRFIAAAIARNLPVTIANHPTGPHAFDLLDDSDMTRQIVGQILSWTVAACRRL